jgi:hypothetical protein
MRKTLSPVTDAPQTPVVPSTPGTSYKKGRRRDRQVVEELG